MKAQASHRQLVSHADSEPSHPEPLMGGSGVRPGNLHFNAHLSGWDADLTLRARIRSFRNLACPSERHVEDRADRSRTGFERLCGAVRSQGLRPLSAAQGGHVSLHLPGCL